jgi:hypothetical protein
MATYAVVQENTVIDIVELFSDEEVIELSRINQSVIDISNILPAPSKGWFLKINKLVPPSTLDPVVKIEQFILEPAKKFGRDLINQFTSENIAMGITQAGKSKLIGLVLRDLVFWLESGSLYVTLEEVERLKSSIDPAWSPFVTVDRLNLYKQKVMVYLGLA